MLEDDGFWTKGRVLWLATFAAALAFFFIDMKWISNWPAAMLMGGALSMALTGLAFELVQWWHTPDGSPALPDGGQAATSGAAAQLHLFLRKSGLDQNWPMALAQLAIVVAIMGYSAHIGMRYWFISIGPAAIVAYCITVWPLEIMDWWRQRSAPQHLRRKKSTVRNSAPEYSTHTTTKPRTNSISTFRFSSVAWIPDEPRYVLGGTINVSHGSDPLSLGIQIGTFEVKEDERKPLPLDYAILKVRSTDRFGLKVSKREDGTVILIPYPEQLDSYLQALLDKMHKGFKLSTHGSDGEFVQAKFPRFNKADRAIFKKFCDSVTLASRSGR